MHTFKGMACECKYLYINLSRSRDGTWLFGCSGGYLFVGIISSHHTVRFGQLLRCAHKRIVNIMKVYIERNNIQVELIRFRKKISTLWTLETSKLETFGTDMFIKLGSLLSVTCVYLLFQL